MLKRSFNSIDNLFLVISIKLTIIWFNGDNLSLVLFIFRNNAL